MSRGRFFAQDLSIREFFLISTSVILIAGLTYAGIVINDLYSSKKALAEQKFAHALVLARKDVDDVFLNAEQNVRVLADAASTYTTFDPKIYIQRAAQLSKNLISAHSTQLNVCWAFSREFSKAYFNQPAVLYVIRKNTALLGHPSFNDPSTIDASLYHDDYYLKDKNEVWYHGVIGTRGIQYTPFFFDAAVTKRVMISLNQAVYDPRGKFIGTTGIDITSESFISTFQDLKIGKTGGIFVVDEKGYPIAPLALRDLPMIGFKRTARPSDENQPIGTLPIAQPFSTQPERIEEYEGLDGNVYLTQSVPMQSRPWHLVAYQQKAEALSEPKYHTLIIILMGIFVFLSLYGITRLLAKTISGSVRNLVSNIDGNAIRFMNSERTDDLIEVKPYGPKEFQHLGKQLNHLYSRLESSVVQLKEALLKAERATLAKSRFLSVMSHEIRTPLNSMIGLTDVLLLTPLNSEQHRHLRVLQRSGQSLLRILNDILDFSRLESGKLSIETHEFDLYELIRSVEGLMRFDAESKGLKFQIHVPDVNFILNGDSVRLRQVLLNLLGNAIKFTNEGTVQLKISTANEPNAEPQTFLFEVIDTGIGISDEQKENIFSEFSQANPSISRRFGGTGLGLSISQQITELLGGKLQVRSEEGRGSTFFFQLAIPVKRRFAGEFQINEDDSPPTPPVPTPLRTGASAHSIAHRILVVDDDEDNHGLLDAYLKFRPDIEVTHAMSGEESLEILKQRRFDLILMDLQMNGMDGLTAVKKIRASEKAEGAVPMTIIILSANTFAEDRTQSLEAGANDHVGKPIKLETFNTVLRSWLKD